MFYAAMSCSAHSFRINKYSTYIYIYTHTGCPGRNVPDFGRMFLKLK